MSTCAQIALDQLSVSFDSEAGPALKKTNLTIRQGECVLLTGQCGCGKSTLLRLVNGVVPHVIPGMISGDIQVAGLTPGAVRLDQIGQRVATVYQNPRMQFFCADPLAEMVFGSENAGQESSAILARAADIASQLGIMPLLGRNMLALSGGELQRIAIASALMDQPAILLLDEPASNLDASSIVALAGILQQLRKSGMTILIAEHRLWFLQTIVDRVIRLEHGDIIEDVPARSFWERDDVLRRQQGLRTLAQPVLAEIPAPKKNGNALIYQDRALGEMRFPRGQITALLGENGAGKSTTARRLVGLEKVNGPVFLDGKPFSTRQRLRRSFLVMQDVNRQLFASDVMEELTMNPRAVSVQPVEDTLQQMNLAALVEQHPMSLSGGQQQRLVIALAMREQRDVVIFDEPTSGLDYAGLIKVAELLKLLASRDTVVILITHDEELVALCADCQICLKPRRQIAA